METEYLNKVLILLKAAAVKNTAMVGDYKERVKESASHLWEYTQNPRGISKDAFPHMDALNRAADSGNAAITQHKRLTRLLKSPYFGRIDFKFEGEDTPEPFYIGIHSFSDGNENYIYDWRAPISSVFYDFELGKAFYDAPMGKVNGELTTKRQYKIVDGELDYYVDTSLSISDEILLKRLSGKPDSQMKHIAETIQREQNRVIRSGAKTLVIQGVAGSGKTSVALHRAAYMLYKHKNLTAENILIISPNPVFADYISDVLPQLGEERLMETDMDAIAANELRPDLNGRRLQTRHEYIEHGIEHGTEQRNVNKSRFEIIGEIGAFVKHLSNTRFMASDVHIAFNVIHNEYAVSNSEITEQFYVPKYILDAGFISKRWEKYAKHPMRKKIEMINIDAREEILRTHPRNFYDGFAEQLRLNLHAMLKIGGIIDLHYDFYSYIGEPASFGIQNGVIEYYDIFPLIYMKTLINGTEPYPKVKHLIIDEMQDYTPVEFAALRLLFPCEATILGDINQSVADSYSSGGQICGIFNAEYHELTKSYRSTVEIMRYADAILGIQTSSAQRHGDEVCMIVCSYDEMIEKIIKWTTKLNKDSTAAIICKTNKQANCYYELLRENINISLINETTANLPDGLLIMSVCMAKGLEFEYVAVADASPQNYPDPQKRLLYVACTRATHSLTLFAPTEQPT